MRRGLALALMLAVVPACNRDVDLPPKPSAQPLAVVPAFESVAPQQRWTFAATGGVGPYTFAFAQGSPLSGAGASIDPSGVYTAGANGSAQDIVEVTDSRGATATALVSVGQKIAINPAFTGTVPGGRISFQATGGDPLSYGFVPGTSGSGGGVTPAGIYTAGSLGDTLDTVIVQDQFGATAAAEIHVGSALTLYRSDTRPVAPHESVTFIALGGQPPYTFGVAPGPGSGNPTIDPASGLYVAGDRAADLAPETITSDVVTVRDSATVPQTATIVVLVGPRLQLALDAPEVFPGQAAQLQASGGKAPYTFAFAARIPAVPADPSTDPHRTGGGNGGNRSRGTVNAFTGEYVPGFSPGAVDYFQVTDATGAPAAILAGPRVGALPLAIGSGIRSCATTELNGDGSEDVLMTMSGDNSYKVTTAMMLDTTAPWLQSYFLQSGGAPGFAADFSGTGRRAVAFVGGDTRNCANDGSWCGGADFWALVPDLVGYLSAPALAGGGPQQWVAAYNDPVYQNASGTAWHQVTTNWSIRRGTGRYDAGTSTWQFWGQGWDADTVQTSVWSPGPQRCFDPTMASSDAWLMRMDWKVGTAQPSRPVCVKAKGLCPTCASEYHNPIAMAVGDFDGDGQLDLAWILDTDGNRVADGSAGAQLRIATAAGGGSFGNATGGWPGASWSFQVPDGGTYQPRFQVVRPPGATADAILVRLVETATQRGRLFLVRAPAAVGGWSASLDPNPSGAGVDGFVAAPVSAGSGSSFYAWSGNDGTVTGFALGAGLSFTAVAPAATLPFAVNAVCLPDVNADGVPDLFAASDLGASAQLILGDGATGAAGAGTFGQLVHQRGLAFPVVTADFDGDGFIDAVVANGSGAGVSVMWGGGGMLAWGAQISSAAISSATAGDYTGDGWASIFFQDKSGQFGKIRSRNDGTFDPAVALTGYAATGGPPETTFFSWPGDLNTAEPGIDALTFGQKGSGMQARALLVQHGRVVDVTARDVPPLDAIRTRTEDCWTLPVGTKAELPPHVAAVALACSHDSQNGTSGAFAVWGTTIANVDSGPAQDGSQPAFGDWVLVTSSTAGGRNSSPAFTKPVNGGARIRVAMVGTVDANGDGTADTAVFLFATDTVYVVEVGTGGDALHPANWVVNTYPVLDGAGNAITGFYPFLGTAGRLDTDPATKFHAVVAGGGGQGGVTGGGTAVLRRSASGWSFVERLGSGGFPIGVGPLSDGSPGDVVFFVGDWANTGLVPEILLRLNDGAGGLR